MNTAFNLKKCSSSGTVLSTVTVPQICNIAVSRKIRRYYVGAGVFASKATMRLLRCACLSLAVMGVQALPRRAPPGLFKIGGSMPMALTERNLRRYAFYASLPLLPVCAMRTAGASPKLQGKYK